MVSHDLAPPGEHAVRSFGHQIMSLYRAAHQVATDRAYAFAGHFVLSPLGESILSFLSRFAEGARYANIDALASGSPAQEPLAEWNSILREVITEDVPEPTRKRILRQSATLAPHLEASIRVIQHDLENKSLSLEEWLSYPRLEAQAARHVVWRVVLLISPLIQLISELSAEATQINQSRTPEVIHVPYMNEFFNFLWVDRAYVLRKRRWP